MLLILACEAEGVMPTGTFWAQNESFDEVLVRSSYVELNGQPQQVYVWRIPPQFAGEVDPSGANNSLVEVLEPGSCEVIATRESFEDELGVIIDEQLTVSFTTDRAERGFEEVDEPALPRLVSECGGEHT